MTSLPSLTGRALVAALGRAGFQVIRIKGSHCFLRNGDGKTTVVPVHGSESIGPGLLAKILRDCDLSREQLAQLCDADRLHPAPGYVGRIPALFDQPHISCR